MTNRIIVMVIATAFFAPVWTLAATTAELFPSNVNVEAGQKFNVAISINPQGTVNYAEKLEINYPADILEATSFAFGEKWMAMTAAGYDSIDNKNGALIKTAGYPGGFSSSAVFGTISFSAKNSGSGTIKIGNSSLAFQASSQSAITGNGISFVATAPASVVPVQKTEVQMPAPNVAPATKSTAAPTPSVTKPTTPSTEVTPTQPVAEVLPELQTAAAVSAQSGSVSVWLWILVVILFFAVIVLGVMAFSKRKNN